MTETITWNRSVDQPPDADITVLACHDGDVFMAWRDDDYGWHDCTTGGTAVVTWWADVGGPQA